MKRDEFLETSNKNSSYLINNEILKDNYFTLSTKINDVAEHRSKIIKQYWNSTMIDVTTDIQKATNAINKSSVLALSPLKIVSYSAILNSSSLISSVMVSAL